jgi:hypothetical protein
MHMSAAFGLLSGVTLADGLNRVSSGAFAVNEGHSECFIGVLKRRMLYAGESGRIIPAGDS